MPKPSSPRAPPTDGHGSGRSRWKWIAGGLAVTVLAFGAWQLFVESGRQETAATPSPRPGDPPPRRLTALEIADPQESRRVAEIEERRERYDSFRRAFGEDKPPSRASAARLEPALRALWPGGSVRWTLACLGQVCRVDVAAPVASWHPLLAADPGVKKLAERVVVDPDGAETPAYLVLVGENAVPGDDVLAAVEEEFRVSSDARECLSRAGATGKVEYELQVDTSGYSFRQQTDLPYPIVDCVDRVLTEILDRHPPPKSVRTSSRTFAIRR
jgi:hypothetical protein